MSDLFAAEIPGRAGLFFSTDDLTEAGWKQERAARARLERWCGNCGQPATRGFGATLHDDGVWACFEADCKAAAEAQAAARSKLPDQPAHEVSRDLFGRAA